MHVRRGPQRFSRGAIHFQQEGGSPDRENGATIHNQGTLPGIPLRHFRAKIPDQIQAPSEMAAGCVQTNHVALGAERDQVLLRHCGGGAAHAVIALDLHRIGKSPELAAIRQGQATQRIRMVGGVVVEDKHAAIQHRRTGIAFSKPDLPQGGRHAAAPVTVNGQGSGKNAIPLRSAKLRPVTRIGGRSGGSWGWSFHGNRGDEFALVNRGLRLIRENTAGLVHARLAFPERLQGAIAHVKNDAEQQYRNDTQRQGGGDQQALPGR